MHMTITNHCFLHILSLGWAWQVWWERSGWSSRTESEFIFLFSFGSQTKKHLASDKFVAQFVCNLWHQFWRLYIFQTQFEWIWYVQNCWFLMYNSIEFPLKNQSIKSSLKQRSIKMKLRPYSWYIYLFIRTGVTQISKIQISKRLCECFPLLPRFVSRDVTITSLMVKCGKIQDSNV